jgi:hypothetical protein
MDSIWTECDHQKCKTMLKVNLILSKPLAAPFQISSLSSTILSLEINGKVHIYLFCVEQNTKSYSFFSISDAFLLILILKRASEMKMDNL